MKKIYFDPEEKRVLESYERGEWKPIRNREEEMAKLRQYARNTLQKNKRINIRLSERDLLGIQAKAVEEGLPYQTLISSILHKYLRGILRERKNA
jgi:predicted DNA binding CopG/RHH family protein